MREEPTQRTSGWLEWVRWTLCLVLVLVCSVGPWFFGAWEMWWFWPFVLALCVSGILAGVLYLANGQGTDQPVVRVLGIALVPFLGYILMRWYLTGAVFLDAERSVLLHVTGIGIAWFVAMPLHRHQRHSLYWCLFGSLTVMAVYGLLNHLVTGSARVLWAEGYPQYAGRACGPYYCPDHFAGAMEILFCMGIAGVLDRAGHRLVKLICSAACLLAFGGAVLSLSRGSGFTFLMLAGLLLVWGFQQWPRFVRWHWRLIGVSLGFLMLGGVLLLAGAYVERFTTYGGVHEIVSQRTGQAEQGGSLPEQILETLSRTSRGRMYAGAWRAWQSNPIWGIGPGMHQHRWLEFAASNDGDRETGTWPTLVNEHFHSYEVHSDWLQLLEEHGLVGLVLFLLPWLAVAGVLLGALRRIAVQWSHNELALWRTAAPSYRYILAGWLVFGTMSFHSLGDFNLQMPGTVWMVAAILGVALREAVATASRTA